MADAVDDFLSKYDVAPAQGPDHSGTDPDQFLNGYAPGPGAPLNQPTGTAGPIPPPQGLQHLLPVVGPIARGITKTLGLPGDLEKLAKVKTGLNFPQILPTSDYLTNNDLVAPITRSFYGQTPDSGWARTGSKALESAAGTLPLLPLLPEGEAANALVAGAAGGAGGDVASKVFPKAPAAEFAGNLLGGGVAGGMENAVTGVANRARNELTEGAQDFKNVGIPLRSVGLTSDNPAIQKTFAPSAPLAQTADDLSSAIERIAGKSGSSSTVQEAGTAAQKEAQRWLAPQAPGGAARTQGPTMAGELEKLYTPVDQYIPGGTPTKLDNFESALGSMTKKGGDLQGVVGELLPTLPARLKNQLEQTVQNVSGGAYTWNDVKTLRSALGEELANPRLPKDISNDQVKQLYAALTDDMRGAASDVDAVTLSQGQTAHALESFNAANEGASALYNYKDNVLANIVKSPATGAEGLKPEDVATKLLNGAKKGSTDLDAIRANNPAIADELAAWKLRDMGLDDKGAVSPQFSKQWNALPDKSKAALWPDPAQRAQIDSAARIADRLTAAGKVAAKSGSTGETAKHLGIGSVLGIGAGSLLEYGSGLMGNALSIPLEHSAAFGALAGSIGPAALAYAKRKLAGSKLLAQFGAGRQSGAGVKGGALLTAPYAGGNALTSPAPTQQ